MQINALEANSQPQKTYSPTKTHFQWIWGNRSEAIVKICWLLSCIICLFSLSMSKMSIVSNYAFKSTVKTTLYFNQKRPTAKPLPVGWMCLCFGGRIWTKCSNKCLDRLSVVRFWVSRVGLTERNRDFEAKCGYENAWLSDHNHILRPTERYVGIDWAYRYKTMHWEPLWPTKTTDLDWVWGTEPFGSVGLG